MTNCVTVRGFQPQVRMSHAHEAKKKKKAAGLDLTSWEQNHLKYFRKLQFCANPWQKQRGTKKDVKGVKKSSYRTSSSTPGTPKLPAVHVQTRSITAGGCSPESTRRTMSRRGTKAKLSGCLTVLLCLTLDFFHELSPTVLLSDRRASDWQTRQVPLKKRRYYQSQEPARSQGAASGADFQNTIKNSLRGRLILNTV